MMETAGICRGWRYILAKGVTVQLNANQKLLLLTLRELRDLERCLQLFRSRCRGCELDSVLVLQQKKLLCLQWEGRHLAIQRGLELPEPSWIFPVLLLPRRSSDLHVAQRWCARNRETGSRLSSALRRYPCSDPARIFCRKSMDFCTTAIDQTEPFLTP